MSGQTLFELVILAVIFGVKFNSAALGLIVFLASIPLSLLQSFRACLPWAISVLLGFLIYQSAFDFAVKLEFTYVLIIHVVCILLGTICASFFLWWRLTVLRFKIRTSKINKHTSSHENTEYTSQKAETWQNQQQNSGKNSRQFSSFDREVTKVRQLEKLRMEKGYKPGWLYYYCKEAGLENALEHLRKIGEIKRPRNTRRKEKKNYSTNSNRSKTSGDSNTNSSEVTFDPYSVLGVKKNFTESELKKAYREQMKNYHPDRVAHLGEELKQVANRRTKEIQRAYEELSKI